MNFSLKNNAYKHCTCGRWCVDIISDHLQYCEGTASGGFNEKTQCGRCLQDFSTIMGIHFADHLSDFLVTEEEIKAKASTKAKVNEEAKAKGKVNVQQMEKANVQKMEEICKLLLVNFTPNEITEGLERAKSSKGKTPWDYKDMKDRKERDKKEGGVFGLDYDMEEKHLVIQEMSVDLKKATTPDPRDIWFQCGVCEKLIRRTIGASISRRAAIKTVGTMRNG